MRLGALIASCVFLACCNAPRSHAHATPAPPVAVRATLDLEPLDLSPDGEDRLLVRVRYATADGHPVHVPPGGHVDVFASRGNVQWQPRSAYDGDPASIVRVTEAGPIALRVTSDLPRVPRVLRAVTDSRAWALAHVVARALGPHAVSIGWFPRVHSGHIRIARIDAVGHRVANMQLAAPASTFVDTSVAPGAHYTYVVERPHADPIDVAVEVPPALPVSTIDAVRGKGAWLDAATVDAANATAILARARAAGLRDIELRMAYGETLVTTRSEKAGIDALIDGAAAAHIAIVGWTVPRAATFEDLAVDVGVAGYRTAAGNRVQGLAVDLERGDDFMGTGSDASAGIAAYVQRLRAALGPHVLIVATVEDPALEHLTGAAVPYSTIAANADVLQPMTYWRAQRAGASVPGMQRIYSDSYHTLLRLAGRDRPVNMGGQTADLGLGAPPPDEVAASIVAARKLGAIGSTLFDWDATTGAQWNAIEKVSWTAR